MKFQDRQIVEGIEPAIYIGHRVRTEPDGAEKVSPMWYAEYCLHNRQRFEALGTSNKSTAIQKAHAICTRIRAGQPDAPKQNTTLKQIAEGYVELMKAQGRAPTTITKYELVARNLIAWSGDEDRLRAATLMESDFWSIRKFLVEKEGVDCTRVEGRVPFLNRARHETQNLSLDDRIRRGGGVSLLLQRRRSSAAEETEFSIHLHGRSTLGRDELRAEGAGG